MAARFITIVPNVLSSFRLALALIFPVIPVSWQLPVVICGGLSDWVDGLIARRYKATSDSGALLDAIADKLFTLSVLITLVIAGDTAWWQACIVLCRDVLVTIIAIYACLLRRPDVFRHMRPRLPGKLATSFVLIWLVTAVAGAPRGAQWGLFALAGAASVFAAGDYLVQFMRRSAELRGSEDSPDTPPNHRQTARDD
jgi:cardiolipin synthase